MYALNEGIAFATTSSWVPVKIYKVQLSERLKDLFDVWFCQIEVQRTDIKATRRKRRSVAITKRETIGYWRRSTSTRSRRKIDASAGQVNDRFKRQHI